MKNVIFIILLFFTLPFFPTDKAYPGNSSKRALVITIDGLRPDAISKINAPNLAALINEGSYTPSAKTVDPPKTLPSHTSLVTGLTPKKHNTFFNEWIESMGYVESETVFKIAKKEGFSTAMFVGKDKLNFIAVPGTVDKLEIIEYGPNSVEEITESFINYLNLTKPEISLIHFPEPDIPGHKHGWMSEEYLLSIQKVDRQIAKIVSELKESGLYGEMIIVITADHGGKGKTHKGDDPEVTTIPWLALGKNIKKNYIIKEQVYIYDTAPTVLSALNLPQPGNMNGRVLKEIFIH